MLIHSRGFVPGEMSKSVLNRKAGSAICAQVHTKIRDDQLLSTPGQGHFGMAARRRNAPNDIGRPFNNLLRRLSASDFALIAPHLAHEETRANDLLYNPATISRSSTSRAGQVLCHTWSPTKTAATSKPFWSAAKAPSAELSAKDICQPIRASWSSLSAR